MKGAKFEIYIDKAGKYRFWLRAPNNESAAVSEAYETKANHVNGVKAVKEYCGASIGDQTNKT